MFLDTLRLNNFRSFEDEQICFGKDLTILVGENNGGKSNTIDALRLITTPLSSRREIYCEFLDILAGQSPNLRFKSHSPTSVCGGRSKAVRRCIPSGAPIGHRGAEEPGITVG